MLFTRLWPLSLLALLPLLYLLDRWQRRPLVRVLPSLMLLRGLAGSGSSPPTRRKGRPSRAFWLQAAGLCALALALCGPFLHAGRGPRVALCLVEAGAAMGAVDGAGRSRVEEARERLAAALPDWELRWMELTAGAPRLSAALPREGLYAPWLVGPAADSAAWLLVVSDRQEGLPAGIARLGVGAAGLQNLGIAGLEARAGQVFVQVAGTPGAGARELVLESWEDGATRELSRATVEAGAWVFPLEVGAEGLRARLLGSDAVAVDDLACAARQAPLELAVAVDPGLAGVEQVLGLLPAVRRTAPESADVRFTRDPDASAPWGRMLFRPERGPPPPPPLVWVPHPRFPSLPAEPLVVRAGVPVADSLEALLVDARGEVWAGLDSLGVVLGFGPESSDLEELSVFPVLIAAWLDGLRQGRGSPPATDVGRYRATPSGAGRAPGFHRLADGRLLGCGVLSAEESRLGRFSAALPPPPEPDRGRATALAPWLLALALGLWLADFLLARPRG